MFLKLNPAKDYHSSNLPSSRWCNKVITATREKSPIVFIVQIYLIAP